MSLVKILHGGKIECDVDGCGLFFLTYSLLTLARMQAGAEGWGRTKLNTMPEVVLASGAISTWKDLELGSDGRRKLDTCPACTAEVRYEHAIWTAGASARKAADKMTREIERVRKRNERVGARLAKRTARHAAREAKAAAKVAARQARVTAGNATAAKRNALAAAKAARQQARSTTTAQEVAAPS